MQTRLRAPGGLRRTGIMHALLAIGLLLGAFAPLAILTAQPARAQDQQIIVGLITKTETNPFFVKMKEGAEKAAQENNVKLLTAAGKFDADNATQVTAIENMVTAGAKGILITPGDTKAIVPAIQKARAAGVLVIALDTPTDPMDATDALFATDNFKAGLLDGQYAKAAMAGKTPVIATIDGSIGVTVSVLRHNGFLAGFGPAETGGATPVASMTQFAPDSRVVCSQNADGDQAKSQTAMENCLQKSGDINLVYTINEPAARGAYNALKAAGKAEGVMIVSVDGGCTGVQMVKDGIIASTTIWAIFSGYCCDVEAVVKYAKTGEKPSGYTDTGVNLITDKPMEGVPSKDTTFGAANCWG